MPPHVLVDFVFLPPEHGRSVTEVWGWDAHEAQLRWPDDVSGDTGGCSAKRALKPKFYQPNQTMVTAGILPFRENSHGRAGNRTRHLMTTRPRGWSNLVISKRKYYSIVRWISMQIRLLWLVMERFLLVSKAFLEWCWSNIQVKVIPLQARSGPEGG